MVTKENYRRPFINPSINPFCSWSMFLHFCCFLPLGKRTLFCIFTSLLLFLEERRKRPGDRRNCVSRLLLAGSILPSWFTMIMMIMVVAMVMMPMLWNQRPLSSWAPSRPLQSLCKKICTKILNPDYLSAVMWTLIEGHQWFCFCVFVKGF